MSIRNLTSFISTGGCEPSKCEACGNSFTCGATLSGCWCTEVKLSEQAQTELRARYQGCLCRECLERFAEADQQETISDAILQVD
jgi:hypothetical protein